HRDVGLATQISLLHVRFRSAHPAQCAPYMIDVIMCFPRGPKLRLSDNLSERRAGPIKIDVRKAIYIRQTLMNILAGIFFEVKPRDTNRLRLPLHWLSRFVAPSRHKPQHSVSREGLIVLRNLIALGQSWIKIVLA